VVPGVILVETMAQCGGAALCKMGLQPPGSVFLLATVNEAKFRRPVRPGDEVRIEVENLRVSAKLVRQRGTCYVGDDVAAQAEWLCVAGVVS
jgi:3-hydroxyacyl-[acyl-carrier-protein] dehydratase